MCEGSIQHICSTFIHFIYDTNASQKFLVWAMRERYSSVRFHNIDKVSLTQKVSKWMFNGIVSGSKLKLISINEAESMWWNAKAQ